MIFRLKKCCCIISLRNGCMISALILLFFQLLAVPIRNTKPCCNNFESILLIICRIVDIIHCIGCLMLFAASYLKLSLLVLIFLVTNCLRALLFPAFLVAEILIWNVDIFDLSFSICGLLLSIYFWIVAYAYYYKCQEEVSADEIPESILRKKGSSLV
ncbi:uncharacterized protein LOC108104952 [Drosophila eugracilis]|uniref:uncharacterized protein LOC108104952 n=1 Tax=Drosophila eugracilis TaxID=29029 RepID=UPI0007E7A57D|nr:uncharacterized protein LOC108104952 [Drosophila eugracilis]